jgi:hypothetical protein
LRGTGAWKEADALEGVEGGLDRDADTRLSGDPWTWVGPGISAGLGDDSASNVASDMDTLGERFWGVAGEEKVREMAIGLTEPASGLEEVLPILRRLRLRSVGERVVNDLARTSSLARMSLNMS